MRGRHAGSGMRPLFVKLKYLEKLIDPDPGQTPSDSLVRITLPFKDQKSAVMVRRQLGVLGAKVKVVLRSYTTVKLILKLFKNPSFRRSLMMP